MSCNWLIYLAYFLLAPTLLPAVTYHRRNYDLRYGNSDVPQWKQRACQKTQREKINLHYICDEKGNVKCLPGWQGDLCQVPQCRKGCDPMNGYCQRPDECRCRIGYTGEFCERCIPLPGCQHGYCNKPFECICKPGWDGLFCTEPTCRSGCHNTRGYCEAPGECRCRLGWAGRNCSDCAVLPGCQRGTCQKPLECNCLPGYTGLLCQTAICAAGCHKQRGYCTKPGECRCKVGWTGPNCDQCFAYPGCVNGDCERPWECNCKPGWGGMLCDEKLTYCDEHPNTCENDGRCISYTKDDGSYRCDCKQGYLGKNCEILDEFMLTSTSAPRITPPPMPSWGDEAAADKLNDDDDDDDGDNRIGSDYQLGNHKVQQNNTETTLNGNIAGHSALGKPLRPPATQLNGGTVTTLTAVDKLTNLNDTKSIVAHDTNNIKQPAAAVQPTVSVQLPQAARNTSVVHVPAATATNSTTTTASNRTHLNLINATVSALSAHVALPAMPGREADENSTIKGASPADRTHSSTTPVTPTAISSPIPIPLHFLDSTHTHNKVTHTAAMVNSNLAAPSGNNAADEDANQDEYEEDGEDEDDDDEEADDEDDDEEGDDDDDADVDDLIPDVLNSVA